MPRYADEMSAKELRALADAKERGYNSLGEVPVEEGFLREDLHRADDLYDVLIGAHDDTKDEGPNTFGEDNEFITIGSLRKNLDRALETHTPEYAQGDRFVKKRDPDDDESWAWFPDHSRDSDIYFSEEWADTYLENLSPL